MKVSTFQTRRRVEFADTDMGGIAHFSRFFIFMETAEHELLASIGTSVHIEHEGWKVGWPRVSATCEYVSPARFGDVLDIHVKILRKGEKSMSYGFEVSREGILLARGKITSVCCVLNDPAGVRAIPIPDFIADRLEAAP